MAYVAGCGGDDSSSGGSSGTPDSSTNTSSSGGSSGTPTPTPDASPTAPSAKATTITIYIGNVAKVDGSLSTGESALTYAWTVKTPPPGSAITTAQLSGANTSVATFTPDKLGVYELELTVIAGAQSAKTTTTVTVVDPPVFYYDTSNDPDAGTFAAKLLVAGGTAPDGGKPVACFERDAGGSFGAFTRYTATGGTDWWEAPAGQPSKAAFVMETTFDGGTAQTLFATTSNGSCATAPTKLDAVPPPAAASHTYEQPRISPDGTRVAFVRQATNGAEVATIGLDGSQLRILGSRRVDNDGGALPEAGVYVAPLQRPFWQGTTHVAWIENDPNAPDGWQIARAPDAANATREVLARCTGSAPSQAAFLPNGEVLVSQFVTDKGAQLIAYPIVAATKTCGTGRVLTPAPDGGQTNAYDFMLSPDGKEVVYRSDEGAVSETRAVKVDGTSAPRKVSNTLAGGTKRGPRYVGSGSYVSFAVGASPDVDGGFDGIVVVPTDGGGMSVAATGTSVEAIGNGWFQACNMGAGAGSGVALAGIASLALLRIARRRRRD